MKLRCQTRATAETSFALAYRESPRPKTKKTRFMLWHETAQACSLPPRWMIEINSIHSLREHGVETETGHHHNFKSPHCNFIQVELTHWIHLTNLTLMLPMPTMLPADMDKNGTWALILRLSCTAWLKEEQCEKQQAWNALIWVMIIYRLYTGREREREREII